nr:NAD(P)-dependent oxidoreductase [Salinicola aestuarinus]
MVSRLHVTWDSQSVRQSGSRSMSQEEQMNREVSVAVLGLGAMGHAFADNLVAAGYRVSVWNRSPGKASDLVDKGARLANSPAEAVAGCQAVITMLPDLDVTREVLMGHDGALGAMSSEAVLIQMGTLGVVETERLIDGVAAARGDVVFIDAPVSGTKAPAQQGSVSVLASGDRERAGSLVEPIFDVLGAQTHWLGEAGQGARMKVVVNAWLIAMMQGIAETARLADTQGIAPETLWSVLEGGPLAVPYMKGKLDAISGENFDPQMALQWGLKDAGLALEAGRNTALPSLSQIRNLWADAVDDGYAEQDIAAIYAYLKQR